MGKANTTFTAVRSSQQVKHLTGCRVNVSGQWLESNINLPTTQHVCIANRELINYLQVALSVPAECVDQNNDGEGSKV